MSSKLKPSILVLSLMGVLGGGMAVAQTAPASPDADADAPATTAPADAAESEAQVQVPQLFQSDDFADVETRPGPRGGLFVGGSIAETGKDFDAIVSRDGELMGVRTAEGSALPQALMDELLPEAARAHPIMSEIAELNTIGRRGGAVMIGGQAASGDEVRIGFDEDGELMRFERGDHGDRGKRGFGKHGERGEKGQRGYHGDRSERGDRDGDRDRMGQRDGGPHEGGQSQGGPDGRPQPGQSPAPVDEAAIRSAVEGAGYSELGEFSPNPRGASFEALNPQGEEVVVFVTPEGEVVRETAR
ncbi:hypothetical protein [Paracoccus albus]|uniref:hypothetical protein n=1 Tax=Paracoccus albus TaxID=3017784 RepID=UPI0022F0C85B|nr:hypothetical protein [Paracoccus albus]WBU61161.1 hypothetical protein PAF20_04400 [Paracoccus albus]